MPKAAAREQVQHAKKLVVLNIIRKPRAIDPGYRDTCHDPEDHQHRKGKEDFPAQVRNAKCIDDGLEHRLASLALERFSTVAGTADLAKSRSLELAVDRKCSVARASGYPAIGSLKSRHRA